MSCEHGWYGGGPCPRCPPPELRAVLNSRSEMRRMAVQKPDALIAEIEWLRAYVVELEAEIKAGMSVESRLREALEWYANEGNYLSDDDGCVIATAWLRNKLGGKARAALKGRPK